MRNEGPQFKSVLTKHENNADGTMRCLYDANRKCIYNTREDFDYYGGDMNCGPCRTHNKIKDRNHQVYSEKVMGRVIA